MSLRYMLNRMGPSREPCVTPMLTRCGIRRSRPGRKPFDVQKTAPEDLPLWNPAEICSVGGIVIKIHVTDLSGKSSEGLDDSL
ncbi:hypothetical protein TNCV_4528961 [Trichonephila clavipes]|nr:hypothetical protein TNCV_4528961 [Trichonephila clavipes]